MEYTVLAVLPVGENTCVCVEGNGEALKNGITICTPDGKNFELLTVGMPAGVESWENGKTTELLVKGQFAAKSFSLAVEIEKHTISVKETFLIGKRTVIVCESFSDDIIEGMLAIGNLVFTDFFVENNKDCFSTSKTRNIVLNAIGIPQVDKVSFVKGANDMKKKLINKQIEWLKQIEKALQGDAMVCPVCKSDHTTAEFFRFPDGVGFCVLECKERGDTMRVSRMKFPENPKVHITDIK